MDETIELLQICQIWKKCNTEQKALKWICLVSMLFQMIFFHLFYPYIFFSFVPPPIPTEEKNAHSIGLGSYLCKCIPIHGAEYPFERFTAGISEFMTRKIFISVGMSADAKKRENFGRMCVYIRYNKTGEELWKKGYKKN